MTAPKGVNPQDIGKALAGLGARMREQREARQSEVTIPPEDDSKYVMQKPDSQDIGEEEISWKWEFPVNVIVAVYSKITGRYHIGLSCNNLDTELSSDEAKSLGLALLSAHQWETVWQQHAGEFLAALTTPTLIEPVREVPDDE
jgi:hypothetical protein